MKNNSNMVMLELVAQGLADLKDDVVFVGGTTTALYITDPAATNIRPTNDVDCIVEITSRISYHQIEDKLRALGFKNDVNSKLICRWNFRGTTVDVMPTDSSIMGFSNVWYTDGIKNRIKKSLPSKMEIYVLPMPYFVATKIEAYRGRGNNDLRTSHDIEDIMTVLDGNTNAENELKTKEKKLSDYLAKSFQETLSDDRFDEAIRAHLSPGPDKEKRAERISKILSTYK